MGQTIGRRTLVLGMLGVLALTPLATACGFFLGEPPKPAPTSSAPATSLPPSMATPVPAPVVTTVPPSPTSQVVPATTGVASPLVVTAMAQQTPAQATAVPPPTQPQPTPAPQAQLQLTSLSCLVQGKLVHNRPADYVVALFIRVPDAGVWSKPTFATPTVPVSPEGLWSANVCTGGNDGAFVEIAAFAIPKDVRPPRADGLDEFPPVPQAVASLRQARRS